MSNIPKFDSKKFQAENIEIANLKIESETNNKINELQNERKQIQDLQKGIEEEKMINVMKKNAIKNEQLKDYYNFVKRKYDKNLLNFKNELPVKIGTENRKNLYEFKENNSMIENNENIYYIKDENNLNHNKLNSNDFEIRQYSTNNNENYYNQSPNHIYSQPLINENNYNYGNSKYNYYLNNITYNNKYGKAYNILENEKKFLKNKNFFNPLSQSSILSYHLPENYFNPQENKKNNLDIYDDYINRNATEKLNEKDLRIEKNQFEYNMPEHKNNYNNNNFNNNHYNNMNIQNISFQNNQQDIDKIKNFNTINYLINDNNDNIQYKQNNNVVETPKENIPDFLNSRKEYIYNKFYNTASKGNIITDPYSKKAINQISEYKKRIKKERDYKELLDEQIIYTSNNYRPLRRSYTNPNPYKEIREKNSPFYELPIDPYNLKSYNYNVISSLPNNPITNPVNSYLFKDKRKPYNGYFKNLGINIIKK